MKILYVLTTLILLTACDIATADKPMKKERDQYIEALIIGSAESPDPVLKRVEELEKNGTVKNVVVLESFPVQIHLKATKKVIDELNNIPRVKGQLY